MDTTKKKLQRANHRKGNCKCTECDKLRRLENIWIMRLGTFHGESGLNARENNQYRGESPVLTECSARNIWQCAGCLMFKKLETP